MQSVSADPVQHLRDALERYGSNPRGREDDFTALCPAHDDHDPSLHVSRGTDGQALIYCFAGCATDDVLAKLGLRLADLFPDDHRRSSTSLRTVRRTIGPGRDTEATSTTDTQQALRSLEQDSTPAEMLVELAHLLRLTNAKITIRAIRLLGNGPSAGLEIDLSDGQTIVTEKFGDLWTHTGLAKFITQSTGVNAGGITKKDAEAANALIRRLADITRETRTADLGRGHGLRFLELAPSQTFTLNDQQDRYDAFAAVNRCSFEKAGYSRQLGRILWIPELSIVLQNETDGTRLVHCGHLFRDVRGRDEVSHPGELARQMTLAGWRRTGKRGFIKATPTAPGSRPIVLPFWRVPTAWADGDEDE